VAANRRRCHPSVADARAHSASPLPPVDLVLLLLPLEFPSENKKSHENSVCCTFSYQFDESPVKFDAFCQILSEILIFGVYREDDGNNGIVDIHDTLLLSLIVTASTRILTRKL
jgi:hypothetical protein